jgi:hypothetical protein
MPINRVLTSKPIPKETGAARDAMRPVTQWQLQHQRASVQNQRRLPPNPPPLTNLRISRSTTAPMKALMIRATIPAPR